MRRGTAKDALAALRWKEHVEDWSRVRVLIRHHGAPGDEKTLKGDRITGLGSSFFEVDSETSIPYHRILRIEHEGEVVYQRGRSSATKD